MKATRETTTAANETHQLACGHTATGTPAPHRHVRSALYCDRCRDYVATSASALASRAAAVLGSQGRGRTSPRKAAASRANGRLGGSPKVAIPERVQLVNPWSGAEPPDRNMSWSEIRAWAAESVHERDRGSWLRAARRYYRRQDGAALGRMIIGS